MLVGVRSVEQAGDGVHPVGELAKGEAAVAVGLEHVVDECVDNHVISGGAGVVGVVSQGGVLIVGPLAGVSWQEILILEVPRVVVVDEATLEIVDDTV